MTWHFVSVSTRVALCYTSLVVSFFSIPVERGAIECPSTLLSVTIMHSTLQRLNHLFSLSSTYMMILLGLISIASFLSQPAVEMGKIDVKDLIMYGLSSS